MKVLAAISTVVLLLVACGADSKKDAKTEAFCTKVKDYDTQFKGTSPKIEQIVAVYEDLSTEAPDAVKGDVVILADYAKASEKGLTGSPAARASSAGLTDQMAKDANKRFQEFVESNCGLDLSSGASSKKFSSVANSIN